MPDKVYSTGWCPHGEIFSEAFEMLYDIETAYFRELLSRPITVRRGGIRWPAEENREDDRDA